MGQQRNRRCEVVLLVATLLLLLLCDTANSWMKFNGNAWNSNQRRNDLKQKCPNVKAIRNFELGSMMGYWYVQQYYASTEELPEYACMRSHFEFSVEEKHVTMNFTYIYSEDPLRERLQGNITWLIPEISQPAHWMHTEDIYEGIYNTYILDTDYKSWGLIMHCAEKERTPRYLSALLLSREPELPDNVITYLREKLPIYDIDLTFMFPINQTTCDNLMESVDDDPLTYIINGRKTAKAKFELMIQNT